MTFAKLEKNSRTVCLLKVVARASEVGSSDRIARICRHLNSSQKPLPAFLFTRQFSGMLTLFRSAYLYIKQQHFFFDKPQNIRAISLT